MKIKHRLSGFLAGTLLCAALFPSFAQAVEKPFENLPQSTDISPATVGNIVGNGAISASSDKNAQTAPESHENPTNDSKFSTFSEKFSTEEASAAASVPVGKSALPVIVLTHPRTEAYPTLFTDDVFSAVWSIDAANMTAELVEFTGKPELYDITLHSQGISVDYFHRYSITVGESPRIALQECISYEYEGFTKDSAAVRDRLNEFVSAEAVTADGTVHTLTFDYVGVGGGNNHYDLDYYFLETLYDDVVEFRFSLHFPEGTEYTPYTEPTGSVYPMVFPAADDSLTPDTDTYTGYAFVYGTLEYGEPDPYDLTGTVYVLSDDSAFADDYTLTIPDASRIILTPVHDEFYESAIYQSLQQASAVGDTDALRNLFRMSYMTIVNGYGTAFAKRVEFTDGQVIFHLAEPLPGILQSFRLCLFPMDRYLACSSFLNRTPMIPDIVSHPPIYPLRDNVDILLDQLSIMADHVYGEDFRGNSPACALYHCGDVRILETYTTQEGRYYSGNAIYIYTADGFRFQLDAMYDMLGTDGSHLWIRMRDERDTLRYFKIGMTDPAFPVEEVTAADAVISKPILTSPASVTTPFPVSTGGIL